MTPNLYLIAHKVRGEPAFDVALRADDMGTDSDPGPWWIIPTSGHRAYPYIIPTTGEEAVIPLDDLYQYGTEWPVTGEWFEWIKRLAIDPVPNHPDHYITTAPATAPTPPRDLLRALGLVKPVKIERRL